MDQSIIITNHHALLFTSPNRKSFAEALWEKLDHRSIGHVFHNVSVLDIDTARSIVSWVNSPYEGKRTAVLSFHTITLPAQNALLKILEEPKVGVKFILVTSNKEALLPTLLSRLQEQKILAEKKITTTQAKEFLQTPFNERMKLASIVSLLARTDDEGRKDREGVQDFILSLIPLLNKDPRHAQYVVTVTEMASYAGDPSSSGKGIIEYVTLLLPELKN